MIFIADFFFITTPIFFLFDQVMLEIYGDSIFFILNLYNMVFNIIDFS
jgi:hypothetical protein